MTAAAMGQHLPGVLHDLEPTLNRFGYLAVLGLVLVEDFGVPVPGETILILAAVYAGTGRLSIFLVAVLGFCGALLGDNLGFALGHFGGRRLAERYGRYVFLTPERLDTATEFFARHGGKVIVIARFVEVSRSRARRHAARLTSPAACPSFIGVSAGTQNQVANRHT